MAERKGDKPIMAERLMVSREGVFSYPIEFGSGFTGLSKCLQETVPQAGTVCVVTDSHVAPLYLAQVEEELKKRSVRVVSYVLTAGEEHKTLSSVSGLYEFLIEEGIDRNGCLAALGGGVVGDMTGFAAATYLRGIPFIQIPTTLLAQVDSSVGGKTGVDFGSYKNMVGAFHQPRLVYMNIQTLKTLPGEQFVCGMGEVLKTGLICDKAFFEETVRNRDRLREMDPKALTFIIRRCCQIKSEIVAEDPEEKGNRALLNLGHTIGHAIEKCTNFALLHGQCVAIGLMAAAVISQKRGLLDAEEVNMVRNALLAFGLPITAGGLNEQDVLAASRKDKKMEKGKIKFILMDGVGHAYVDRMVSDEELLMGIRAVLS